MNGNMLGAAAVLLVLGVLVGFMKQTWLLSGYNQRRVKDKDKLAKLFGGYSLVMGIVLLGGAFIDNPNAEVLIPVMVIGYVVLLVYVNTRMVG